MFIPANTLNLLEAILQRKASMFIPANTLNPFVLKDRVHPGMYFLAVSLIVDIEQRSDA